ncbi:lysine exporter LysO family protein [Vibrio sp. S4M6]|uniref:lysine exporter LysO family protein n=1 Tax=Vibrio sinus TaxID=2946865 RepID=UPI00202A75B8|nr:lysine exporter LysO family protein [Vibrio sinus]MCL9782744.1 lysine exporter LysO family protein [Vibrio sinus]
MVSGMVLIFAALIAGYLVPITKKSLLDSIIKNTSRLVYIILALMGLSLSALDNLSENLQLIVQYTVVFFLCIGVCNLVCLPLLDKCFPVHSDSKQNKLPLVSMAIESAKLVLVVAGGLVIGLFFPVNIHIVESISQWILLLLLFLIGIQLRNSGLTLKQIILNKQGMLIAAVIVISSMVGGIVASQILGISVLKGLAMSSGFGWYSLSGILIGGAYGPIFGGASFLVELMRELFALILIPLIIGTRPLTAIGYAGATALDFTLPVIQTTGGVRCVPIAIVSGFILSLLVPVLMLFFISLAG